MCGKKERAALRSPGAQSELRVGHMERQEGRILDAYNRGQWRNPGQTTSAARIASVSQPSPKRDFTARLDQLRIQCRQFIFKCICAYS